MDFAAFIALVSQVWAISFPLTDLIDVSLGQLVIWTTVLGIGISFGRGLIRG